MTKITDLTALPGFDRDPKKLLNTYVARVAACVDTMRQAIEADDMELLGFALMDAESRTRTVMNSIAAGCAALHVDDFEEWFAATSSREVTYGTVMTSLNRMQDELAAEES